jgi:pimeloyl-ACP methyl ester carboxylesterase
MSMPLNRRIAVVLAGAALLAAPLAASAPAQAAETIQPNILAGIAASLPNPAAPPPGVNNYGCQLTTAHPQPVILIPGTFANMEDDYGALAPILVNDGYCVFSLNYGGSPGSFIQSIGPVPASAQQVGTLISQVSASYGGAKVDLVGHSQGGMLAEYVAKVLGYAPDIHAIVALSPTTHGTSLDGLTNLASFFPGAAQLVATACPACADQETGSAVINTLDNGPIAQSGVSYTIIETLDEFVVTPVGSSFIHEAGVTNEYVQSYCPFDPVDHADLSYDNVTIRLLLNALDPAAAKSPNCFDSFPASAVQQ